MELVKCATCNDKKTALKCDKCADPSCKHCSYFADEDSFAMLTLIPIKYRDKAYCTSCYHDEVAPHIERLQETLEVAKDVDVYMKDQGVETRLFKRLEKQLTVIDCDDREETLMRLAFLAAEKGFGTIVDVDLTSRKLKISGAYQKVIWSGTATPVNVN